MIKPLAAACLAAVFASAAAAADYSYTQDTELNSSLPQFSSLYIADKVNLTINNGTLYDSNVFGGENSSLTINISKNLTQGTGIYLASDNQSDYSIKVGTLTLNNLNSEDANNNKGVYVYSHQHLTVDANVIRITASNDGLYTGGTGNDGNPTKASLDFFAKDLIYIEAFGNDGSGLSNHGSSSINLIGIGRNESNNVSPEDITNLEENELKKLLTGTIIVNGSAIPEDSDLAAAVNKSNQNILLAGESIWINQIVDLNTKKITGQLNAINGLYNDNDNGVHDENGYINGSIEAIATNGVNIFGTNHAVYSSGGSIYIKAIDGDNEISSDSYALYATNHKQGNSGVTANSTVEIVGNNNTFTGLVAADASHSSQRRVDVSISSKQTATFSSQTAASSISETNTKTNANTTTSDISAIYATGGASIDVNASKIVIETKLPATTKDAGTEYRERAVWAKHGTIDLSGSELHISAQNGSLLLPNNPGAALVAGAAYDNAVSENDIGTIKATGLKTGTRIFGDLVAGQRGVIDFVLSQGNGTTVMTESGNVDLEESDEDITGNALAANGGVINLTLGSGVVWSGRADDYQDADSEGWNHDEIFTPEFSKDITKSGDVNVTLNGAYWNVTGQSWVTTLSGSGGTINLINSDSETGAASHALHVGTISGQHTFVLNLDDTNHALSDMLYIHAAAESGQTQVIAINSLKGLESMKNEDRIRFATVNVSDSVINFIGAETDQTEGAAAARTFVRDAGFFDVGFRIESETRKTDATVSENEDKAYDGGDTFDEDKSGSAYIDQYYDSDDAQNWYLVRDTSADKTSDAGEAVLATARAAYWNAVEIDRLNKRLGDARHADGGTEGFWVRVRNDRIGTSAGIGDFRSRNNMYQIGYDHTKLEDDGKRLFGAAFDYMDGDTSYKSVAGTGATDRFGVTAYMTWLGQDGWYYDLVGKWGVLSNSFRIANGSGSRVEADYDNHVLGASFEFGRKLTKDDSLWFLEPQAQIQHMMITEASYGTSQDTRIDQDKINSTITRLGFRVGRNFGEKASGLFYAKADWLKEWHGHQQIAVTDITTGNMAADASIDNKGSWFDVGLGFQSPITDETYFFADAEYVFGNDFDNTWNFNAGVRWMFR